MLQPSKSLSLTEAVNILLKSKSSDKKNELQSVIHREINFRRNSVNLLIGRRGSGKTYNVFRELMKLTAVDNDSYTLMLYVTDKADVEDTVKKFDEVSIQIRMIKYDDVEEVLKDVIEAKVAYDQVRENGIEDLLTEESYRDITETVGTTNFDLDKPHTIVLYDDAMNVFRRPQGYLYKMLHENRQPRITYFLCLQDFVGVGSSVRSNQDAMWLFGGFNKMRFNQIMYQTSTPIETSELWEKYKELTMNQCVIFDNRPTGTELKFIME